MIYAIKAVGTPYIKFGYTTYDVRQRLGLLQTGCPHDLELLAFCKGSKADEANIHSRLLRANCRHRGEWFKDCPAAQLILNEMKSGEVEKSIYQFTPLPRKGRLSASLELSKRRTGEWKQQNQRPPRFPSRTRESQIRSSAQLSPAGLSFKALIDVLQGNGAAQHSSL